jgi:hypothetical protein
MKKMDIAKTNALKLRIKRLKKEIPLKNGEKNKPRKARKRTLSNPPN